VAAAAYRSGEKIKNEYDGIIHDYTRKGGIAHTEILLPDHAPREYLDRAVLWNSVEKIEKNKNSQLSREIELALPVELSAGQNISLVREYCRKHFVSAGMCADICIHDKQDGNPHAHIMLTMRPMEQDGSWGAKSKKEYILDEKGEHIRLKSGAFKTRKVNAVDWNEQTKAEIWRGGWADIVNQYLAQQDIAERVDHRSYERQGIDQIPTVHMGVAASQMECRGIVTERGNMNRRIKSDNQLLRALKGRIRKLKNGLDELLSSENPSNPIPSINLIEALENIISGRESKSRWSKIADLKSFAKAFSFLQANSITTLPQLRDKVSEMYGQYDDVSVKIKKAERRLKVLDEHIKQSETYLKNKAVYEHYKNTKPKKQEAYYRQHSAEIILYESADRYLKKVMNGRTNLPIKKWKAEAAQLTAEKNRLYQDFYKLRDEVREVEIIKRNVEQVMQADVPKRSVTRNKGMEL